MSTPTPGAESPASSDSTAPESKPSYEQARDELVAVVQRLESGGAPLDESLALWERGETLANVCQGWLDGAKGKIDAARAQSGREERREES